MNQKLLTDKQVLEETIWLVALHIEKFLCKNNTLPCNDCKKMSIKLTPLFLVGIEGIAEKTYLDAKKLANYALDKIGMQKWEDPYPWKQNSFLRPKEITPIPENKPSLFGKLNNLFSPKKEEVLYKLATRVPTKEKE